MTGRRHPTLYRFFDKAGAVIYIGSTWSPHVRWSEHEGRDWFPDVATVTVEHYTDADELREAERAAIRTEQPRYNRLGLGIDYRRLAASVTAAEDAAAREQRHADDVAALRALAQR